jgi:hypothetical protein
MFLSFGPGATEAMPLIPSTPAADRKTFCVSEEPPDTSFGQRKTTESRRPATIRRHESPTIDNSAKYNDLEALHCQEIGDNYFRCDQALHKQGIINKS